MFTSVLPRLLSDSMLLWLAVTLLELFPLLPS